MPHIEEGVKLDFKDVLLRPKRSTLKSRSDVDLNRSYHFKKSGQEYTGVPLIAANMDTIGTFEMALALNKHNCFTAIHKHYTIEEWTDFAAKNPSVLRNVAVSSGTGSGDFDKLKDILKNIPDVKFICLDVANGYSEHFVEFVKQNIPDVKFICLDVANGYSEHFVEFVKQVRNAFPTHTIMAGNVVTGEMVEELILAGADIIKVGIGPGSVCTTRKKTGVGYPQLSAVLECMDAAHGLGGHIISDGGCTCPGDVCKAFGAGADFVMLGGMLSGHDQCGGDVVVKPNGKKVKQFYGMSSSTAMNKHHGGVAAECFPVTTSAAAMLSSNPTARK
ncbi:unnamed protein product [Medioppia subpectinata]|uniref:GMP reductase n=1 Tax=Medioppia subpectinata TaxID=1979941 RepID=A0A7R9PX20_9ACAR|nr:unnamed protein product [Medioppia subpectinata]CAG2103929.1 unnamed protein product [Medioppia subpectinata]